MCRFSLRGGRPRLRKRGIARRLVRAGKRFFGGLNKLTWSRGTDRDYRDHSHFGGYAVWVREIFILNGCALRSQMAAGD